MKNSVLSFIRHLFTAIGAVWAVYGGVEHDKLEMLCGAVMALVGAAWGIYDEWKAEREPTKPAPKNDENNFPQSPLIVAMLAVFGVLFSGCASGGGLAGKDQPLDPTATVEKALPYIKVGATLAMGAGLKYGVSDPAQREAIANLSWSVSHAVWTLTDGQVPTVASLTTYLQSFDYELQGEAANAYDAMIGAIAALYGGYYADLRGNPALTVKVLNAIAEGAAAGSAAYATTGQQP
ncbi:MAG: hypothetical protein LBK76_09980 [Verrucomicrobiales bacterium]|jgi:hypothetical protein|nr:hypothetical protein [Verrucomicrobiales bacterium]